MLQNVQICFTHIKKLQTGGNSSCSGVKLVKNMVDDDEGMSNMTVMNRYILLYKANDNIR